MRSLSKEMVNGRAKFLTVAEEIISHDSRDLNGDLRAQEGRRSRLAEGPPEGVI